MRILVSPTVTRPEDLVCLSLGSLDWQTSQSQQSVGTPRLVPEPMKVKRAFFIGLAPGFSAEPAEATGFRC